MSEKTKSRIAFVKKHVFWRNLLLITLIISLIPILVIAMYNHSSADDFSYGYYVHQTWNQTHNVFEVMKTIGQTVLLFNKTWQGTYSAIVLFMVQPAVWGEQYYFLTTYILLAFILLGIFSFFRSWIGKKYNRNDIADIVSCCVSVLFIQMVPMPVESLFWWNGASFYVIWNAVMLIQVSCFLTVVHTQKCSALQCVIMFVLGILLAGSNYITALLTVEITVLFLAYCVYMRNNWKQISIVLVVTLVGFIISVSAPGNAVRQQQYETVNPLLSITESFLYAYRWAVTWTPDMLILLLLFCLPFAIGIQLNTEAKTMQIPLWVKLLLLIGLFTSTFTPTIYAGNVIGPERAQNIRFLLWVIVCFISEFLVAEHAVNWIRRHNHQTILPDLATWFSTKKIIFLVSTLMILGVLSGMRSYYFNKFDCFTSVSATYSLLTGKAQEYDRVADGRMQLLLSDEKNVVLQPFLTRPFLLFFNDITDDPNDLSNQAMAIYFDKETVQLQKTD
ncbi:MAG: DUF6056 family protein [Christensenella sp.]|nr:DUF6056 family protein [Christensenella sp.]